MKHIIQQNLNYRYNHGFCAHLISLACKGVLDIPRLTCRGVQVRLIATGESVVSTYRTGIRYRR